LITCRHLLRKRFDADRQDEMNEVAGNPAKEARRQEILDAAFEEFSAKGYAGASMEAIARRAHASKETLYAWFKNKETLLNTLFAARLDGMTGRAMAAAQQDASPANVLPIIAEDLIRFMLAIEPLSQAIDVAHAGDKALRLLGATISEERARFVDYLLHHRASGEIAFDDDPFELASLFVAMAQGEWSLRLGTGMLDELTDRMIEDHGRRVTRIFLKGIAPDG
jgi:AcrR family transcriptional regulator